MVTALAVGLIAGFTRYSINVGFSTYVERAELSRIDSLAPVLEWEYGHRRGWSRIEEDPNAMWWLIAFNEYRNGRPSPLGLRELPPQHPSSPGEKFEPVDPLPEPHRSPETGDLADEPPPPPPGPELEHSAPPEGQPKLTDFPADKTPPVAPQSASQNASNYSDKSPEPGRPFENPHYEEGRTKRTNQKAQQVLESNTNTPYARHGEGRRPVDGERFPPRFPPQRMEVFRRLGLFDASKRLIWGSASAATAHGQILLKRGNHVIGYLKLSPSDKLTKAMDREFVENQNRNLLGVCIFAFSFAALAGLAMSQDLVSAITILVQGTRQLAAGNFKTRITLLRTDELGQLAQDFNSLADALEQHDRAHRQWIADTSHELRTPLAVLRAQVEAFQDGVQEPNQRTLGVLHAEIMTLNKLVDDLYHLAKSDVGELRYQIAPVDIPSMLIDMVEVFEERFESKEITVETDFDECPAMVDADQSRLRQLFLNLLENSHRYTDRGGKVRVSGHKEGNSLVLWFDDSPPGVSDDFLPKIFERFFRGELSRSRDFGGCGLGMAICRTIVEGHGGTISASHSPLGGLRVQVKFNLSGGRDV